MDLSIVIPVYNCEKYIERCVEPMFANLNVDLEIILINDGSTDRSGIICENLKGISKKIQVFHKKNGGASSARNLGLSKARGEYIWFVDADDFIIPHYIDALIGIAQAKDLDLLQFGWNIILEDGKLARTNRIRGSSVLDFSEYLNRGFFKGVLWQSLIRRSSIGDVTFNENISLWEDGLFFMELFSRIKFAQRIENKVYNYCQNDHSITHNIPFEMCLKTEESINQINLPAFATNYRNVFIAYYASLSLFSDDYKENMLFQHMQSQNVLVKRLFFVRLIQNLLTYNYGFLKRKRGRLLRLVVLQRAKSFTKRLVLERNTFTSRFIFWGFRFIPSICLDFIFYSLSPIIKLLTLRY